MRVVAIPEVMEYIESLVPLLYEKGYFGIADTAKKYVDGLYSDIQRNLPTRQHKRAPKHYTKYGEDLHYASFVKNKRTTWYAFFTKYQNENDEIIYLIRYIGNNHTEAQYL
jgi:hypothetical protein